MIKINVITNNNNWYRIIKNPVNYVTRKIDKINRSENFLFKKNIYCTLLLSGDKEIKNLNKKFRKKNKVTDVLSFPFYSKKSLQSIFKNEKEIYIGDIIINLNKVKKKKFKIEFDRLWIHGLVHLFGYDHKKERDYLIMHDVEKEYMNMING